MVRWRWRPTDWSTAAMRSMAVVRALVAATRARHRLEPLARWRPPTPVEAISSSTMASRSASSASRRAVSDQSSASAISASRSFSRFRYDSKAETSSPDASPDCSTVPEPPVTRWIAATGMPGRRSSSRR